jgi:hypothetical protein
MLFDDRGKINEIKKSRDTVSFKELTYAGQVVGLGAESLLTADESPTLGTPTHRRSEFTRSKKTKRDGVQFWPFDLYESDSICNTDH